MRTRREIEKRRVTMHQSLRAACVEGRLAPGTMLSPMRELAEQYGVSPKVAWQVVQALVDEGVLHTISRIGTFVSQPQNQSDVYLLTLPHNPGADEYFHQIQLGFEERVAQLGGVSLRLTEDEAREHHFHNELPPLAGLYRVRPMDEQGAWWPSHVPTVEFDVLRNGDSSDKIRFDDVNGGRQATRHLLATGHRKIAYLSLHTAQNQPEFFFWSVEREIGWAQTMKEAECPIEALAFHIASSDIVFSNQEFSGAAQLEATRRVASEQIVARRDITAVVTANVHAAQGLLLALDEAKIPFPHRPAILCFDDAPWMGRSVVSYLRLPWDEVGRAAAQLLWERKTGQLDGPAQQRLVQVRLIPRLTCHPAWKDSALTRRPNVRSGTAPYREIPLVESAGI